MSFWRHYYHIVWATKAREPFILSAVEPHLYAYLVSKAGEMGVFLYALNGTEDHVHIVAAIPPKHSVAWVVKMLKGASAYFVNTELRSTSSHFAWQRGYGSLTIGEKQRTAAMNYVHQQKAHHREGTANAWLERCDDEDGLDSLDKAGRAPAASSAVREPVADYTPIPDLPW